MKPEVLHSNSLWATEALSFLQFIFFTSHFYPFMKRITLWDSSNGTSSAGTTWDTLMSAHARTNTCKTHTPPSLCGSHFLHGGTAPLIADIKIILCFLFQFKSFLKQLHSTLTNRGFRRSSDDLRPVTLKASPDPTLHSACSAAI